MKLPFSIAAAIALAVPAPAQTPLSISSEIDVASQYLWRGWVLNRSASLQPSVTVGYRGLSVTAWQNLSRDVPHHQAWTESDLTVDYTRPVGKFALMAGYTWYTYPDLTPAEGNRSHEAYAGVSHADWLNPAFKMYYDWKLGKGYYYNTSVAHSFPLTKRVAWTCSVAAGMNQHQFIHAATLSDVDGITSLDIVVTEHVKVSPGFVEMVGNHGLFGSHHAFLFKAFLTR